MVAALKDHEVAAGLRRAASLISTAPAWHSPSKD